jgi:hypothetical protein
MELEAYPNESPQLQPAGMPGPSQKPSTHSPVNTKNRQIKKYHLLDFSLDLVAEKFMLTDAVSHCEGLTVGGQGRYPLTFSAQTWHFPTQSHF